MNNYEINKAVAEKLRPRLKVINHKGKLVWDYTDHHGFLYSTVPDYCSSWGDAGPIIEEYGITLVNMYCHGWECHVIEKGDEACNNSNKLPLVAAMSVFLEMEL